MKKLILIFFIATMAFIGCNQTNKQTQTNAQDTSAVDSTHLGAEGLQDISEVITRFARAYAAKDNDKANKLIHPDLGLTVIYRPGAADNFVRTDSINFSKPVPDYYPYTPLEHDYALMFESIPKFSCDTEKWDKQGFICDTTAHPNILTQIALFENEFNEGGYSKELLEQIKKNEESSFRVIITAPDPLIFHVQRHQNNWYVTVLDRAYGGCDA